MNGKLKPFVRGKLNIKPKDFISKCMSQGMTREIAKHQLNKLMRDEVWINSEYQVNVDKNPPHAFPFEVWHLSVKRVDKQPIHDWRDLQAIKNAICGDQVEAMELYPSESRVMDTCNQYHLWAFMEGGTRIPVGWTDGVKTEKGLEGSVQRSFS